MKRLLFLSLFFTAVSVQIIGSTTTPIIGQNLTLTCAVTGAENYTTTHHWRKDGTSLIDEVGPTLSFSPLRLSHVGQYTCLVTINNSITKYSDKDIIPTSKVISLIGLEHTIAIIATVDECIELLISNLHFKFQLLQSHLQDL